MLGSTCYVDELYKTSHLHISLWYQRANTKSVKTQAENYSCIIIFF